MICQDYHVLLFCHFFIFLCQTNLPNCVNQVFFFFYQDRKSIQNELYFFGIEFVFFKGAKFPVKSNNEPERINLIKRRANNIFYQF